MLELQDFQGRLGLNLSLQFTYTNTLTELDEPFFFLVYPTSEFVFLAIVFTAFPLFVKYCEHNRLQRVHEDQPLLSPKRVGLQKRSLTLCQKGSMSRQCKTAWLRLAVGC